MLATEVQVKALLSELVAMRTFTDDPSACKEALDWCQNQVSHLPLHVTEFAQHNHHSLILTTKPTKHPKVLLLAHIDVAQAAPEMCELVEQNGNYYGRGVFDMKFAIATYLKLLLELDNKLSDYDLGVMITSDEEGDGAAGVQALVGEGWRADVVINPDAIPGWQIESAVKGILRYKTEGSGENGHGSRPWLYRNALTQLMDYLQDLRQQFITEPCGDPGHAHSTLSVNVLNAGQMVGQIPHKAVAEFEIRLSPNDAIESVKSKVDEVAKRHTNITVSKTLEKNSTVIDSDQPYVHLLKRCIAEEVGRQPQLSVSHGQSDSAYFRAVGVPALTFGTPGGGHHSKDEWIEIRGTTQFYHILRLFVDAAAK